MKFNIVRYGIKRFDDLIPSLDAWLNIYWRYTTYLLPDIFSFQRICWYVVHFIRYFLGYRIFLIFASVYKTVGFNTFELACSKKRYNIYNKFSDHEVSRVANHIAIQIQIEFHLVIGLSSSSARHEYGIRISCKAPSRRRTIHS